MQTAQLAGASAPDRATGQSLIGTWDKLGAPYADSWTFRPNRTSTSSMCGESRYSTASTVVTLRLSGGTQKAYFYRIEVQYGHRKLGLRMYPSGSEWDWMTLVR